MKEILIYKLKLKLLLFKNIIFYNKKLNIIIRFCINNLIIISSNKKIINSFIKILKNYFNLKNLNLIKDYSKTEIDYNLKNKFIKLY